MNLAMDLIIEPSAQSLSRLNIALLGFAMPQKQVRCVYPNAIQFRVGSLSPSRRAAEKSIPSTGISTVCVSQRTTVKELVSINARRDVKTLIDPAPGALRCP